MSNSQLTGVKFIIIGGGAIGCAVGHALARAGKRDILVLERAAELGAVTTAQGAGLCGQVRDSLERVQLARHSVVLFRELENDSEFKPDWHEVGSIRIALGARRAEEFERLRAISSTAGLEVELLGNKEAQRR